MVFEKLWAHLSVLLKSVKNLSCSFWNVILKQIGYPAEELKIEKNNNGTDEELKLQSGGSTKSGLLTI